MSTSDCANPDCPRSDAALFVFRNRRYQILDQEFRTTGDQPSAGTVLYHFAAVTCSAGCAMAVLKPIAEREERDSQEYERRFAGPLGADQST